MINRLFNLLLLYFLQFMLLRSVMPINKIISISPGGFKGFYQLGIGSYIKETYYTDNILFTGASAGAWVSLMMVHKGDHTQLINDLIKWTSESSENNNQLSIIVQELKTKILSNYKTSDFDLSRLFVGVVQIDKMYTPPRLFIHNNFLTLEEAVDCCIASSHIPFITGGLIKKYKNKISFDGGFSNFPYLKISNTLSIFHIHPKLWIENELSNSNNKNINRNQILNLNFNLHDYTTLFSRNELNLYDLYNRGYNNSINNKHILDKILCKK